MLPLRLLLAASIALALPACQHSGAATATDPASGPTTQLAASARTRRGAVGGSGVGGELAFTIDNGGVRVTGTLTGLKPGATHALHVHEFGDCSAPDATSAGGHFNPTQQAHGNRAAGGAHHAGDIPNQVAGADGVARVDQLLAGLEIGSGGASDIVGKGVIVHAKADDYTTQPTGGAGGRIACGVIGLENAPPTGNDPAA